MASCNSQFVCKAGYLQFLLAARPCILLQWPLVEDNRHGYVPGLRLLPENRYDLFCT